MPDPDNVPVQPGYLRLTPGHNNEDTALAGWKRKHKEAKLHSVEVQSSNVATGDSPTKETMASCMAEDSFMDLTSVYEHDIPAPVKITAPASPKSAAPLDLHLDMEPMVVENQESLP